MCLTKAVKIQPQEDIVCYKVFKVNPKEADSDMLSPAKGNKVWKFGKTATLDRIQPELYRNEKLGELLVGGGAYHSYHSIDDIPYYNMANPYYVICKCIIPKNSKYVYSGLNNYVEDSKGYASQKLKPIEAVTFDVEYLFERFMREYSTNPEPVKK